MILYMILYMNIYIYIYTYIHIYSQNTRFRRPQNTTHSLKNTKVPHHGILGRYVSS